MYCNVYNDAYIHKKSESFLNYMSAETSFNIICIYDVYNIKYTTIVVYVCYSLHEEQFLKKGASRICKERAHLKIIEA